MRIPKQVPSIDRSASQNKQADKSVVAQTLCPGGMSGFGPGFGLPFFPFPFCFPCCPMGGCGI